MRRQLGQLSTVPMVIVSTFVMQPYLVAQEFEQRLLDLYGKAQKAASEGRYTEAEAEYEAILKLDPSLAEAYANLGMVYYSEFKYVRAIEAYKQALRLRPTLTLARVYLGVAQFYLREYPNSIRSLEAALVEGLEPSYRKIGRTYLARNYLALDQVDNAIPILKSIAQEFPGDTDILYILGKTYLHLATQAAEKLSLLGNHPRVHLMLAEKFANQKNYKEAIDEFRAALELDPKIPEARLALALYLLQDGRIEEGQKELRAFLELIPTHERARDVLERSRIGTLTARFLQEALMTPDNMRFAPGLFDPAFLISSNQSCDGECSLLEQAQFLFRCGDDEEAATLLKEFLSQNPAHPDALYWLAKSFQTLSVRAFARIVAVAPDSARAHQLRAEGLEKQQQFQEAITEYDEVLKREPNLPRIHYAQGMALLRSGSWEAARKAFERELQIDPLNARVSLRLGQLARRAANYNEALRFLAKANEIDPESGESHLELSLVLIRNGSYREALPHLLAAARLLPDEYTIHFQLFRVYRGLGQKELAQRELQIFQRRAQEVEAVHPRHAAQSPQGIPIYRQEAPRPLP